MSFIGVSINIKGVVQGVGFRYWCYRKAGEYNISGYVANLSDGSVEIAAEGEKGLVEEFIKVLRVGPSYAHISDLKIDWYDKPHPYEGFRIEYKD